MDEKYIFEKTLEERLAEFKEILCNDEQHILPAYRVKKQWSFCLELVIDHCGWQGLWKIPRERCEELKIQYPNVVIAFVESINFETLTAMVKILAVHGDIHLPEVLDANLIELFPTKGQDEQIALDINKSAEYLDMLQFFYNNLWMPWDLDEDDGIDWPSLHLEPRLQFYYDTTNGVIPRESVAHVKAVIYEAKSIMSRCHSIGEELSDVEEVGEAAPAKVRELVKMQFRLTQIRQEFETLESPELRQILLSNQDAAKSTVSKYWLVFIPLKVDSLIDYLEKCKEFLNITEVPNTSCNLQNSLREAKKEDIILLGKGNYEAKSIGGLEGGGQIIGLFEAQDTIIKAAENTITLFDFFPDQAVIKNVTIQVDSLICTIAVRTGCVTLENCILEGCGLSFGRQGIVVFSGGQLILNNCKLSGFSTAVVCKQFGSVKMSKCIVMDGNTGLMFYDKSKIALDECIFKDCQGYGICLESSQMPSGLTNIHTLNGIEDLSCAQLEFGNNKKGDVTIIHKPARLLDLQETPAPRRQAKVRREDGDNHSINVAMFAGDDLSRNGVARNIDSNPLRSCNDSGDYVDMEGVMPIE